MSGKAYTMREMKTIVDYLAEHKAYHEIKGRKMWIDLQHSKVTNRTWQSLKETFIKRILPDISNPYYKLSTQQITSFKQGYDVEARINNRLGIKSVSQDSNTDEEIPKVSDEIDSCDNKTGEKNKETDIRDSTETLVLENYEDPEVKQDQSQTKTFKELQTYSEPLTSMLQVVIDNYTSDGDGSNDEPKMQIVEPPESDVIQTNEELIIVLEGSDEERNARNNETSDKNETKIPETTNEQTTDKDNNGESSILLDSDILPNKEATTLKKTDNANNTTDINNSQRISAENISNSTTDTSLPANQEALNDKDNKTNPTDKVLETLKFTSSKRLKRRAISQENHTTSKKRLIDSDNEKKTNSDCDTLKKNNKKIDLKEFKINVIDLVEETSENDHQEESNNHNICVDEETNLAETSKNVEENTQQLENPCLKSVSLYEEQFSNKTYSDSDNTDAEDIEKNKMNTDPNEKVNAPTKNVTVGSEVNEVVVLKSNSEPDCDSEKPPATTKTVSDRVRNQRDRALASMFGFTSGGVTKNRRRTSSYRKQVRRKLRNLSTDSSEGTSDTSSEFVSPPRGRKIMQTRKYLKPKSARVLSLEEGLFVMYGKKIYPVVKDGKIIKNYVSFTPEDDVDPEESYWKLKYVEEKKRTAELTKLLKNKNDREERIPEVPSTSVQTDPSPVNREADKIDPSNMVVPSTTAQVNKVEAGAEETTVKVKFTKNNEEVQLEGHWSHVNPVLAQVLQLLQKEPQPPEPRLNPNRESVSEMSSVKSSSVIVNEKDASERVNKLENEIFKEIEQIEKEVQSVEKTPTSNNSLPKCIDDRNVTKSNEDVTKSDENVKKRKGRPKKIQTNQTENTLAKKSKLNLDIGEDKPIAARRSPRTANKTENNNIKENNTPKTRQNTPYKMKPSNIIEDNEAKYKFPSPNKNATSNTRPRKSNSTSLDMSDKSVSTHGHIDSDPNPLRISTRKKKRFGLTYPIYRPKQRVRYRRTFLPSLTDDDSSNSYKGPIGNITFVNSSLSSNIYKSESYQLLMNNNLSMFNKNKSQKLEIINEISPQETQMATGEIAFDMEDKSSADQTNAVSLTNTDSQSSTLTLPTSPVLSIVENISINKSMIENFAFTEDVDMIDNNCTNKVILNKLMSTGIDASMPLMQQECDINSTKQDRMEYHFNINAPTTSIVSESLLNKMNTVNIEDPPSETINEKFEDLILESSKKGRKKRICWNKNMEQDESNMEQDDIATKKAKAKKRSSTPRKRNSARKLKLVQNDPCIEEEHMETCSRINRKSCPPAVQLFEEVNYNNDCSVTLETNNDKPKTKTRRKKDIIKVKTYKPRKEKNECIESRLKKNKSSSQVDIGINVFESILQNSMESVDLIHNHTDNCLNASECLEQSIELIEEKTSIISINSSPPSLCADNNSDIYQTLSQELYCTNARDATKMDTAISDTNLRYESSSIFHTPLGSLSSHNSLFTEDLSNDPPSPRNGNMKWYLFSDEETTNSFDGDQTEGRSSGGANLNQIFPITCAVPNLSTITEISKDNDETQIN